MSVISSKKDIVELTERIKTLLLLKQEEDNCDFKEKWYTKNKESDMLHDIICMANNPTNKDGLIVFGIEDKEKTVCGVEHDENRKTTQNIVDFLRDKPFHGDFRPLVQIVNIVLNERVLDVMLVFATKNVPYVLKKNFQDVRANHIYSRVGDSNTPKDRSVDWILQEKLWRRHFGLDLSPLDRIHQYLDDVNNWIRIDEEGITPRYYYRDHPEFTVNLQFDSDRKGFEVFFADQFDMTPSWAWYNLYYYNTKLDCYQLALLDGGRATVPTPETYYSSFSYRTDNHFGLKYRYRYYIVDSIKWKVFNHFRSNRNLHSEESIALRKFLNHVLVFNSQFEFESFNEFLFNNFSQERVNQMKEGYFGEYVAVPEALQPEYKFTQYCINLLSEFRNLNQIPKPNIEFE